MPGFCCVEVDLSLPLLRQPVINCCCLVRNPPDKIWPHMIGDGIVHRPPEPQRCRIHTWFCGCVPIRPPLPSSENAIPFSSSTVNIGFNSSGWRADSDRL